MRDESPVTFYFASFLSHADTFLLVSNTEPSATAGSFNKADSLTLSTQCNMPCGGDSSENCGGPDAIQVYVSESFAGSLG